MTGNGAASTYLTQALMTASPAQLIVMLLEKAIASLNEAIAAIEAGEIENRWKANKRAIEIVNHLDLTLDMDQGAQIAENLRRIYTYALRRLNEVDFNNDPQAARDVIKLLEPMLASWRELARGTQAEPAASRPKPAAKTPSQASAQAPAQKPEAGVSVSLNLSA